MTPRYQTIAERLLGEFSGGTRPTNIALPSEAALQRTFGVSRTTVRKALAELQSAGMVVTRRGIGSHFVPDKINQPIASRVHFRSRAAGQSEHTQTRILSYTVRPASTAELAQFGGPPKQMVGDLCRLLTLAGQPIIHQRTVLRLPDPAELTSLHFQNMSLYRLLQQRFGLRIATIAKTLEAVAAPADVAKLLLCQTGDAAFRIQRIGSTLEGSIIELSTNFVRGDRFYFSYSGINEELEN